MSTCRNPVNHRRQIESDADGTAIEIRMILALNGATLSPIRHMLWQKRTMRVGTSNQCYFAREYSMRAITVVSTAFIALSILASGCDRGGQSAGVNAGPGPGPGPAPAAPSPINAFGEKPYVVCDEGGHRNDDRHADQLFQGKHLKIGDEVTVVASGPSLHARLAGHDVAVTSSPDGAELRGEGIFDHRPVPSDATNSPETAVPVLLVHQVRITKSPDYQPPAPPAHGCTPGRQIIAISICTQNQKSGDWECAIPGAFHQGDVHAQL